MHRLEMVFLLTGMAAALVLTATAARAEGGRTLTATPETLASVFESLGAGDTVILESGVYKGSFEIAASGTQDAPIRVTSADKRAVFDGQGANRILELAGDYIEISGVEMCNVRGSCIHAFGRKGLRFVDVYFHDFRNAADMCLYCQDCLVDRCLVTGTGGAGVRFDNSTRITITGNVIRMKTNYGLKLLTYYYKDDNPNPTPQVMTVVGNDISVEPLGPDYEDGDHGKGMMLWSIRDSRIEGNYIHSPTSTGPGIVIGVCEEKKDDPSMASSDNVIANNVVDLPFSLGYCLWVQNASKNMAVTGNIFTGGAKGVLGINPSCKEGLVSDRNILAKRADGRWIGDSLGGTDELRDKWLKGGLDTASNFAVMAAPQDREAAASAHKDDEYPGR